MSHAFFVPLNQNESLPPPQAGNEKQPEMIAGLPVNNDIMRSFNYLNAFSPAECEVIRQIPANSVLTQKSILEQQMYLQGFRQYMQGQVEVLDLSHEAGQGLIQQIRGLIKMLNARHYHFEVAEQLEIQRLTLQAGQHIDWHFELGDFSYSTRKLALILFLTPLDAYAGGAFEIMARGIRNIRYPEGNILVYPAYSTVSIQALTQGKLQLLTAWLHGNRPFF